MADHRLKRRLVAIEHGLRKYSREVGQTVTWYEFKPSSVADSTDTDLYDEGGAQLGGGDGRHWYAGVPLPVIQAFLDEGVEQFQPQGQYQLGSLRLILGYAEFQRRGFTMPADRGAHLNDRVEYDNRLWSVDAFLPRGRISNKLMTITVEGTEVTADEQQMDDATWHD